MVDISVYRSRIGSYNYCRKVKPEKFKKFMYCEETRSERAGQGAFSVLKSILKIILIYLLLPGNLCSSIEHSGTQSPCTEPPCTTACPQGWSGKARAQAWTSSTQPMWVYQTRGKKQSNNFLAKYKNGNRRSGILNMHLNIRSMKNKMSEVKNLVK